MFAYVELNDHDDENRHVLAPVSGHGLIFEEVSEGRVIISALPQKDRAIKAPSYEAIRVAMFAAGMVLDCTVAEADLTASLLSDGETKRNIAANAITDAEEDLRLAERNAELAAAKEALAEMVAIKSHLLRLAPVDEKFCHLTPADAVSELVELWERQRTLIRQMQMDAREKAAEIAALKSELRYEREQRFGKAAAKSEGEAS